MSAAAAFLLATVPSLPASTVVIGIALRLTTAPQAKRQRVVMATTAHRVEDARSALVASASKVSTWHGLA
ncbi:hypothetical protein PC129_g22024 [Phytophthora cactorum]|uniref:Uncharacterized protein n=1 Tax=Phytophthora cactorum TaxID=29920 RepID=A0A8T0YG33_9STRA|nr:hypothetical protein Pcac1_g6823 [Phytophthora cactorum]KAG2795572.1 hypothetical protein PC112_g22580 [Phytophthora cactorum]KAG2821527.1 hypothetical protein PC113_g22461 [Phytophthora cactorum]KAG2874683.1 hypothetical protein PC114_g25134 [Phytophthora cactorum]KAG2960468.1 hypothetical protein PC118_g22503 [Phytophthora cactorum]